MSNDNVIALARVKKVLAQLAKDDYPPDAQLMTACLVLCEIIVRSSRTEYDVRDAVLLVKKTIEWGTRVRFHHEHSE